MLARLRAVLLSALVAFGLLLGISTAPAHADTWSRHGTSIDVYCWGDYWRLVLYWYTNDTTQSHGLDAVRAYRLSGNDQVLKITINDTNRSGYLNTSVEPAATDTGVRTIPDSTGWRAFYASHRVRMWITNANYSQCESYAIWDLP